MNKERKDTLLNVKVHKNTLNTTESDHLHLSTCGNYSSNRDTEHKSPLRYLHWNSIGLSSKVLGADHTYNKRKGTWYSE